MNFLKSVAAVGAGFIAVLVLSVGTDAVLAKTGIFPAADNPGAYASWMLVLALAYRSLYAVVGGFLTAVMAPSRPMRHAVILGFLGLIFGGLGTVANWSKTLPGTEWYPIALLALTLPCIWLGGKLKVLIKP
jgi:hypothetical protein